MYTEWPGDRLKFVFSPSCFCNHLWLTGLKAPTYKLIGIGSETTLIQPGALPALQALGQGAVLQYDHASPHRARVVNDSLQQQ